MNWKEILEPAFAHPRVTQLKAFIKDQRTKGVKVYPESKDMFRAFDLCPYDQAKVVIIGQDPYHTPGTADGLAFSTRQEKRPPSLEVIFKEIYQDLNIQYYHNITFDEFFPSNSLEKWAANGFLLLNTSLTVEEGKPGSHANIGWEIVIRNVIEALNKKNHVVLLCLWGSSAKEFKQFVNPSSKIVVMEAAHPAAELHKENAGFYYCRHFSIIRDVIPTIQGTNLYKTANLDSCFDRDKAIAIIKENYPIEADKLIDYIKKDLFIHIPVNKETYWNEMKKIELILSTR